MKGLISITYNLKYQIDFAPHYKFTTCKKLINCRTGRVIKKTTKGAQAGYYIEGEFVKIPDLKNRVELIPFKEKLPF